MGHDKNAKYNHDVFPLVKKHLLALYKEMAQGNYCEVCLHQTLIASATGTILANTKSLDLTSEFLQACLRDALDAHVAGRAEIHDPEQDRKPLN